MQDFNTFYTNAINFFHIIANTIIYIGKCLTLKPQKVLTYQMNL
jgi:hypothetical protein